MLTRALIVAVVLGSHAVASAGEAVQTSRVLAHARHLTVEIGPRPVNSKASKRAAAYIVAELARIGVKVQKLPVGRQIQPKIQVGSRVIFFERVFQVDDPNLVARFRGGDAGSKAILIMAHYDTVAGSPGAVDNAAAVGILLELARLLRASPPARPVILAFTAAEEQRLAGARALARSPLAAEVGLALSLDLVGSRGHLTLNGLSSLMGKRWLTWIAGVARRADVDIVAPIGHRVVSRRWPQLERSDHGELAKVGVPAFHLYHRSDARIFLAYHTHLDTLEQLDEKAIAAVGRFTLRMVHETGELPGTGGDPGFWLNAPGGPYVISSAILIAFELALTAVAIFGLVLLWLRRERGLARGRAGMLVVLPAFAVVALAVSGALRLAARIAGHPRPWVHDPLPYVLSALVAGGALAVLIGWLSATRWQVGGRARYLATAIVIMLAGGLMLVFAGAPELGWVLLWSAAAMGGMAACRSPIAGWSLLAVSALPLLELLSPSFLREAVFHGFLGPGMPLGLLLAVLVFSYAMAAVYASMQWIPSLPRTSRGQLILIGVSLALIVLSVVNMLARTPACTGERFTRYGLACELRGLEKPN